MANVLEKIVADKRLEVTERERQFPLTQVKSQLTPSTKSLFDKLSQPKVGFIFECKKASPSKGLIREHFDLDEILAAYVPYAAGISVLTDEKYFQGKYEYLAYVTQRSPVPVLNKDFFVAPYQVYLARYYNADAILLMLSVLDDTQYRELANIADSLQLDILTEVSNPEEMQRAINLQAKIIGINNRNLRDLSTDLATTEQLVPMLNAAQHEYVVISESGIYTHADVRRLSAVSNGFLVGSSLMAQQDLANAVKQLVHGDVKVCGITQAQDAQAALAAGATHLGLIMVPESPRYVAVEQAKLISSSVAANYVGVFKNNALNEVVNAVNSLPLIAVQLHGNEDKAFRLALRDALPKHVAIWQAAPMSEIPSDAQMEHARTLLADNTCDKVLFDCKVGAQDGGTGKSFDWSVLKRFENQAKWILAGGIGEHNIIEAARLAPSIIDINSKVEVSPGVKDAEAIIRSLEQTKCCALSMH